MRLLPPTVCALALVAACGGRHDAPAPGAPAASTPPADVTLGFDVNVDVAAGEETYVCVVYELGALASAPLAGISWEPPTGALAVHHISLYALGNARSCNRSISRRHMNRSGGTGNPLSAPAASCSRGSR